LKGLFDVVLLESNREVIVAKNILLDVTFCDDLFHYFIISLTLQIQSASSIRHGGGIPSLSWSGFGAALGTLIIASTRPPISTGLFVFVFELCDAYFLMFR
jgi:hypothetical protein